jgi:hypothetical protein
VPPTAFHDRGDFVVTGSHKLTAIMDRVAAQPKMIAK